MPPQHVGQPLLDTHDPPIGADRLISVGQRIGHQRFIAGESGDLGCEPLNSGHTQRRAVVGDQPDDPRRPPGGSQMTGAINRMEPGVA
ncbi:MAG: hypothetical protein QOH97_5785 [Actinoplanes sp.]|nr:hypothetical protein [Actinoplanes sp.]